jgi:hypothetical protein
VTTIRPPRRALVGAALAAALIGTGISAFADDAPAGGCPTWTDPKGDSTTGQAGVPGSEDAQMDIVAASFGSDAESLTATITSDGLGDSSSDAGDEFRMVFTVAGVHITMYADRWVQGTFGLGPAAEVDAGTAGFFNEDDDAAEQGEATVAYDVKAKTVTIKGKISELAKAVGKPVTGQQLTEISAETSDQVFGGPVAPYDDAPTKLTITAGADCANGGAAAPAPAPVPSATPSAQPSPSASPAPAPGGAAPAGLPAPDCFLTKDPKGDAILRPVNGVPGDPAAPNDPDLDVTSLTLGTDAKNLNAYIKVDALAAGPMITEGHRFYVTFTFNKHSFTMAGSAYKNGEAPIRDGANQTGQVAAATQLAVDGVSSAIDPERFTGAGTGFVESGLKYTFDVKNSYVIASLPLADLEKYGKAPAAGAVLTGVYASGNADNFATAIVVDSAPDGASSDDPASKLTYGVGDNHCFGPAPSPLSNLGVLKAQYGDVAPVAAKLVDAAGAPVAGKPVTFALGSSKAVGTTGADGVAKAALLVKEKAGKRTLVITSGDATTSVSFTVLVEKTALKAVGGKGGVTATLTDDDRKPVAGQVITFASGSKKLTARTNAQGVAKVTGLPPGNVKVTYAGAPGMYAAASTTTKA